MRAVPYGVALMTLAVLASPRGTAAQEPGAELDVPHVEVEPLGTDVHLLRIHDEEAGSFVNAALLVNAGGTVLVDHAGDWRSLTVDEAVVGAVRRALAEAGAGDLDYLVNTHWHGDHTAGNPHYPEATVVAHENVLARLSERQAPWWFPDGIGPMRPEGRPEVVFRSQMVLLVGEERVHLWHFGPAHTDGDAVVYFERARVVHMGDLYHGLANPSVGEDMDGLARTMAAVSARVHPGTRVVTGHGQVTDVQEMSDYGAMLEATLDLVRSQLEQGRSAEQIVARGLPDDWAHRVPDPEMVTFWLTEIHRALTDGG